MIMVDSNGKVTGPITRIHACLVRPSAERFVTITGHIVALLRVVREGKVLAIVDHNLEALIVDNGPEANVAVHVRCQIGKIQPHQQRTRRVDLNFFFI